MRPRLFIATVLALPACAFQVSDLDLGQRARAELLACRYERAVELYRQVLAQKPTGDNYYGLTRALLRSHRAKEAYVAAAEGVKREPRSVGAQTAVWLRSIALFPSPGRRETCSGRLISHAQTIQR
jgi:hypothetical protein